MDFFGAIGSGFRRYVQFSGRSCRSEYWYWVLFVFVASLGLKVIDAAIFPHMHFGPLGSVFSIGVFLPGIAVAVRRLHDVDRSGWWFLLVLVPIVGWIVLLVWACKKGDEADNRFGPDPLASAEDAAMLASAE